MIEGRQLSPYRGDGRAGAESVLCRTRTPRARGGTDLRSYWLIFFKRRFLILASRCSRMLAAIANAQLRTSTWPRARFASIRAAPSSAVAERRGAGDGRLVLSDE